MKQLPDVNLEYVQGRQDRDKPYHTLCTMSKLNVGAVRKTAQFQDEHGAYRGIVPMTPGGSVHLLGPHRTITSDYTKKLRYTAAEVPLRLYMLKKYEWCPDVYNSVNCVGAWSCLAEVELAEDSLHKVGPRHPSHHAFGKYIRPREKKMPAVPMRCRNPRSCTSMPITIRGNLAHRVSIFPPHVLSGKLHGTRTHRIGTLVLRSMVSDRSGGFHP